MALSADLFSEEDLATLDAEIDQYRAAREALGEEEARDSMDMEGIEPESPGEFYLQQQTGSVEGDHCFSHLQNRLVSCFSAAPFHDHDVPEVADDSLRNFVSKIQWWYDGGGGGGNAGGGGHATESTTLFGAIKSALAEIEVS